MKESRPRSRAASVAANAAEEHDNNDPRSIESLSGNSRRRRGAPRESFVVTAAAAAAESLLSVAASQVCVRVWLAFALTGAQKSTERAIFSPAPALKTMETPTMIHHRLAPATAPANDKESRAAARETPRASREEPEQQAAHRRRRRRWPIWLAAISLARHARLSPPTIRFALAAH